jgi:hypothetical protein
LAKKAKGLFAFIFCFGINSLDWHPALHLFKLPSANALPLNLFLASPLGFKNHDRKIFEWQARLPNIALENHILVKGALG